MEESAGFCPVAVFGFVAGHLCAPFESVENVLTCYFNKTSYIAKRLYFLK